MALGKLFRTTVFKISLAYLVISAIGAGLVLGAVGWNMEHLIDEQIAQTIDTDITGLSEQYAQGGMRRLVNIIQKRTRRPGAGHSDPSWPCRDDLPAAGRSGRKAPGARPQFCLGGRIPPARRARPRGRRRVAPNSRRSTAHFA